MQKRAVASHRRPRDVNTNNTATSTNQHNPTTHRYNSKSKEHGRRHSTCGYTSSNGPTRGALFRILVGSALGIYLLFFSALQSPHPVDSKHLGRKAKPKPNQPETFQQRELDRSAYQVRLQIQEQKKMEQEMEQAEQGGEEGQRWGAEPDEGKEDVETASESESAKENQQDGDGKDESSSSSAKHDDMANMVKVSIEKTPRKDKHVNFDFNAKNVDDDHFKKHQENLMGTTANQKEGGERHAMRQQEEALQTLLEQMEHMEGVDPKVVGVMKEAYTEYERQHDSSTSSKQDKNNNVLGGRDRSHEWEAQDRLDQVHQEHLRGDSSAKRAAGDAASSTAKKYRKLPIVTEQAIDAPQEGDPLRATNWPFPFNPVGQEKPVVKYLGVLVDGGRHFFPMEWLMKLVDRLADMNYNLIHLRLTDDQAFNVFLKSHPELAYPSPVDNPDHEVYSVDELRQLTKYAKQKGISIMPEINVPGHAGAWGSIPDLIVECPKFICLKGYGLPMNVRHEKLRPLLTDVLKEIVDIFDPPYLHLGGDEVSMAEPCLQEVYAEPFDYAQFELMLKQILKSIGFPEDRVVRWEITGSEPSKRAWELEGGPAPDAKPVVDRAGSIEHFWSTLPGDKRDAKGEVFVSTGLYFDTNGQLDASDIYDRTKRYFSLKKGVVPTAIIVGTFELSAIFWYERNVLGRLLAVSMAASHSNKDTLAVGKWREKCESLGLGEILCETDGRPVIHTKVYARKWRSTWFTWKKDICERLTEMREVRTFKTTDKRRDDAFSNGQSHFWQNFPLELPIREALERPPSFLPTDMQSLVKHTVKHTGVVLDAVSTLPTRQRLLEIIEQFIAPLGFNHVQLPLVNNFGFVFESEVQPELAYSVIAGDETPLLNIEDLTVLANTANSLGIDIVPEISATTDAAGWGASGFLTSCPDIYCTGKGVPINVHDEKFLPVFHSVIVELRKIFKGNFFHLGSDERQQGTKCFQEAGIRTVNFDAYEHRLEALMTLADLSPDNIIRYENDERIHYSERAGTVTHYRARQWDIRPNEPSFLTVDLFDGDGYNVFLNAKKVAALNPLGVVAEIRKLNEAKWKAWSIPKRLLAFAMGLSEIHSFWTLYDAETFSSYFKQYCEELKLDEDDCSPPEVFTKGISVITETEEFIQTSCDRHTIVDTKRAMKIGNRFFFEPKGDKTATS